MFPELTSQHGERCGESDEMRRNGTDDSGSLPESTGAERRLRILLSDFECDVLDLLSRVLSWEGFEVARLENTSRLGTALDKADFDVVVTETLHPVENFMNLLRRHHDKKPGFKVILMTTSPDDFSVLESCGYIIGVLRKPIALEELIDLLAGLDSR